MWLTLACERSTSAGRSHLFPTSNFTASGHPLGGGGEGEERGEREGERKGCK